MFERLGCGSNSRLNWQRHEKNKPNKNNRAQRTRTGAGGDHGFLVQGWNDEEFEKRYKMAKSISARALVFALAIVICLTLLSCAVESSFFFSLLYPLLYPGEMLSVLITGGHGGTRAEEWTGFVAGFLVNTFCYYLLCAAILAISGHTGAKRAS